MKTTDKILVRCNCGKILYVAEKYAGKKGRCPQCARSLRIPEKIEVKKISKVCSTCGAYLDSADQICVSCHTNVTTGDWPITAGGAESRPTVRIWQCATVGGLLFTAVMLYFLLGKLEKKTGPSVTLAHKMSQELSQIESLSEGTGEEVADKIAALQSFSKTYGSDPVRKSWDMAAQLRQKQHEFEAVEVYHRLEKKLEQEKNPFCAWVELSLYQAHFPHARHQETLSRRIRQAQEELVQFLRSHAGELSQLIQERRLTEITTRTTPRLLSLLEGAWDSLASFPEHKQAWNSLLTLYGQIPAEETLASLGPSLSEHLQLEHHRNRFADQVKRFRRWMYVREYDLAQQGLEKLWESLHALENINSEDHLITAIRHNLKEVQAVKTLFSIANEGAKEGKETAKTFMLKNGTSLSGEVANYALGYFHLQSGRDKVQIALRELAAAEVVGLALKNKKNRYVYEYAGIFYLYEREFDLAKQSFSQALGYGADRKEMEEYLRKVEEEVSLRQKNKPEPGKSSPKNDGKK